MITNWEQGVLGCRRGADRRRAPRWTVVELDMDSYDLDYPKITDRDTPIEPCEFLRLAARWRKDRDRERWRYGCEDRTPRE